MTIEEIKKHIQKGCKVKLGIDPKEYEIEEFNSIQLFVKGFKCSFGYATIKSITWLVPNYFTKEHIGHWIEIKTEKEIDKIGFYSSNYKTQDGTSVCGTWQKITDITTSGDVKIFGKAIIIDKEVIVSYTPILQPQEPKPLLLKDCPVWSFVKLKSKEGANTPWNYIISKGPHEIIVSQDGSEGSPDPESEVLELIENIGKIPEHAIIRTKNSMNYIPISEFKDKFGKFSDIAAIITESQNNTKILTLKDVPVGSFVELPGGDILKVVHKVSYRTYDTITCLDINGNKWNKSPEVTIEKIYCTKEDIPDGYYIKFKQSDSSNEIYWYKKEHTCLVLNLKEALAISKTNPEEVSPKFHIKVGDWVKHFDFPGWQKVVANTTGISVNDGSKDHGFYSKDRVIEHQVAIPDQEWDKLKPCMWVKIAPREYIESKLPPPITPGGYPWYEKHTYSPSKIQSFADKWVKVGRKDSHSIGVVPSAYLWHRDFIVDISETEPQVNCPVVKSKKELDDIITYGTGGGIGIKLDTVNGNTNTCKEVPLDRKVHPITYDEASHMSWSQMNDLFTMARDRYKGIPMNEIPLPGGGGMCVLGTTPTDPDWCYKWLMKDKTKEKIMLNTVEEIGKLDKPNLEEAAKQVKASRDNDEVAVAKKRLTELLNQESELKVHKADIDKRLQEVQELIKAFGYPPK